MDFSEWLVAALEQQGLSKRELAARCHVDTATLLLSLGVDMRTVQTILGHTSMRTTEVYAHVMPELTREAMARLDGLMRRDGAR